MGRAESLGSFAADGQCAGRVGFNEPASLSGFVSLLAHLDGIGKDTTFFGELRQVGSHHTALELIQRGEIDGAAIDANVWRSWREENPESVATLASVEVLGPYPVQPVVVRAAAGPDLAGLVAEQLARPELVDIVRPYGLLGFGPVTAADYEALGPPVRRALGTQYGMP